MSKIEIKNRWSGEVVYSGEHETLRNAVCAAIVSGAYLIGANLSGADLTSANLDKATFDGPPDTTPPTSLKEAAERTKEWLSSDNRWMRGKWIETPSGAYAGDCKACLHGAAAYVGGSFGPQLSKALCDAGYTVGWNDQTDRTLNEVLDALDAVAGK